MFQIESGSDALIVVDVQPDFMSGGKLSVPHGEDVVSPIARLMVRFELIVATQDWHPRRHVSFASTHGERAFTTRRYGGVDQTLWPDHCIQGTAGAALDARLPIDRFSMILRKGARPDADSYSAFRENPNAAGVRASTGLAGFLRDRGAARVFVVGLARDVCVEATALDAIAAGFATIVLDDLVRSVRPELAPETTRKLEAGGVRLALSTDLG